MKQLFKEKVSKFGSLISLIAITTMLVVFSLVLPEFIGSAAGRIFIVVWALTAIIAFIAHVTRMNRQRPRYNIPRFAVKKDVRTNKMARTQRSSMRG
ncbi:hypothetical protein SPFL3102_00111 [Sporomusaceae bacterium FL31]|nr:hypothetical protein SPFL3101_02522 [Sporomusaceae bacterium FL31]GCE32346.1 hypothetical protein SPFL3102_00111 [Sporomusaceae bacterium]